MGVGIITDKQLDIGEHSELDLWEYIWWKINHKQVY